MTFLPVIQDGKKDTPRISVEKQKAGGASKKKNKNKSKDKAKAKSTVLTNIRQVIHCLFARSYTIHVLTDRIRRIHQTIARGKSARQLRLRRNPTRVKLPRRRRLRRERAAILRPTMPPKERRMVTNQKGPHRKRTAPMQQRSDPRPRTISWPGRRND